MVTIDANLAILALCALALLAAALPWWPYKSPLPPLDGFPVSAVPSFDL